MKTDFDVIIAGGGYVGLTLAVALAQAGAGLSIAVADPRPLAAGAADPRASAIAAAASRMFEQLGVWAEMRPFAQPIDDMIVTDSKLADSVRPVFLTFRAEPDADGSEAGRSETGQPFAHMLPNGVMVAALARRAAALGVEILPAGGVADFAVQPGHVDIALDLGDARVLPERAQSRGRIPAPA